MSYSGNIEEPPKELLTAELIKQKYKEDVLVSQLVDQRKAKAWGERLRYFSFLHYESYGHVVIVYLVRFSTITIKYKYI